MSKTLNTKSLNLIDILLRRARTWHDLGLYDQAKTAFERLASFRQLPAEIAEEAQVRLADICRKGEDRFKERQHLAGALAHHPHNPEHHFRMAEACRDDEDTADETALLHFREAVRRAPTNFRYLAGLGEMLVRVGDLTEGLRFLNSAHALAEDDLNILERYARALVDAERDDEARRVLKVAMFRHSSDRRFRDLERDFRFRAVADAQAHRSAEPVILPMIRSLPAKRRFEIDRQIFRIDAPESKSGPARGKVSRKRRSR